MKLFSAQKDEHLNRVKINFLGIKLQMSNEKGVFKGLVDGLSAKIMNPFFINKNKNYIQNKKDDIKRRLFITTGNINLINNLAIMNQLNLWENSENDVLVWSGIANCDFIELSRKLCAEFPIHKFYSFLGSSKNFYQYIIKNFLTDYDDIYFVNINTLWKIIHKIYKHSSMHVTDEGACTVVPIKSIDYDKIDSLVMVNYLGKIDYVGYSEKVVPKIIELKREEVSKVFQIASKLVPFEHKLNIEDKWIVLCGTFNGWRGGTYEDVLKYQNEIIKKLTEKGYKILFKPHPRDTFNYEETEQFKVFNSRLSMECYDISEVMAVVSLFSSVSLQIYYYQDIPSFIMPETIKDIEAVEYRLIVHYAPPIDLLYDIDTNCPAEELKQRIKDAYCKWLEEKPMMHENKELIKLYEETL